MFTHDNFHIDKVITALTGIKVIDLSKAASGHPAADPSR